MISGTAAISPCGRYRYELTRSWSVSRPEFLVVMLNPSTADAAVDDPTIRRVLRFARDWGYGEIRVMNLYALRSPDPADLSRFDAVGPENDQRLAVALRNAGQRPVLAAWGCTQWARSRATKVLHLVEGVNWQCLGSTRDGSPRHPLYVRASQLIVPFAVGGQT